MGEYWDVCPTCGEKHIMTTDDTRCVDCTIKDIQVIVAGVAKRGTDFIKDIIKVV